MSSNKLTVTEAREVNPVLRHFLVHVVKRCAGILSDWIADLNEASKTIEAGETVKSNGNTYEIRRGGR